VKILPPKLPEVGRDAALYRWMNQLRDCIESLKPIESVDMLTSSTNGGVGRRPVIPESVSVNAPSTPPVWQ